MRANSSKWLEYDGSPFIVSASILMLRRIGSLAVRQSSFGRLVRRYFQTTKPDLVHFQGGYLLGVAPILAARASGVPSVLTLHDYWFLCRATHYCGDNTCAGGSRLILLSVYGANALMKRRYQVADRLSKETR